MMDYVLVFNAIEVVLWTVVGAILLTNHVPGPKRLRLIAALGFLLFAGSDAVEMRTGAWWRPWWLLVWKATCLFLLVGTAIVWLRYRRSEKEVTGNAEFCDVSGTDSASKST
ncbi:MAG: hypothetical protein R3C49_22905 [Planctomycetaceae bacterium]